MTEGCTRINGWKWRWGRWLLRLVILLLGPGMILAGYYGEELLGVKHNPAEEIFAASVATLYVVVMFRVFWLEHKSD